MNPTTAPTTTSVAAGFRPKRGSSFSTSGFRASARNAAVSVQTNRSRMRDEQVADEAQDEEPRDDLRHRPARDVDRDAARAQGPGGACRRPIGRGRLRAAIITRRDIHGGDDTESVRAGRGVARPERSSLAPSHAGSVREAGRERRVCGARSISTYRRPPSCRRRRARAGRSPATDRRRGRASSACSR